MSESIGRVLRVQTIRLSNDAAGPEYNLGVGTGIYRHMLDHIGLSMQSNVQRHIRMRKQLVTVATGLYGTTRPATLERQQAAIHSEVVRRALTTFKLLTFRVLP